MPRCVLFDSYPHVYGGGQRTVHLLALGLPALGWQVDVVTTGRGILTERIGADGIATTVIDLPPPLQGYGHRLRRGRAVRAAIGLPAYWRRVATAIRGLTPDVMFVNAHRGLLLGGLPASRSMPVVWHVGARHPSSILNRFGAAVASAVVVPAAGTVGVMPSLGRCRRVVTAESPIPDRVRRAAPVERTSDPVVVTTGRLHPDKGVDVAIDALVLVRREVPDARLVVVGGAQDGYESVEGDLVRRAGRLGLDEDAVTFVGFHDQPHEVVGGARVYLQASRERTEILPLAIVEAMATGIPVVATDVGAVSDVVRPGETGRLVAPEDAAAMASALVDALAERSDTEQFRQNAFAAVAPPARTEATFVGGIASLLGELVR